MLNGEKRYLGLAVILAIASFWAGLVAAQSVNSLPAVANQLSLPKALELARTNYPSLRGKLATIRAAEAEAQGLQVALLPQAGVQAQTLNATSNQVRGAYVSNGGLLLPISGVRTDGFNNQATWTSGASLVVDWEAVTFGRRQARRSQARLAIEQAQADYEGEFFTHQVRVCDAYLLALNAQKSVALQTANLQRAQALQRVIRASTEGGLRPGIDSAIANTEVARARLQVLESQQLAQQQVLRLTELIGQPNPTVQLDSMAFYNRLPRLLNTQSGSVALHPQLRVFQKSIELGKANEALLKAAALPSVSVLGSLQGRGSGISERAQPDGTFRIDPSLGAGLPLRSYNYIVGVTAIWRPTDLLRSKYALSAQRERINAFQQTYNQQALGIQAASQNASLQLELAQARADQAPLQLDAAQQAYTQSQARYESGLDNILALTQTTALLNRAEVDQAIVTNSVWRALLLRAATAGDLDSFLQQIPR
ncbi:TolC family protein [Spirosoma sp. KCTC 42546]|uniref:TolC family protein n=1 Tax=Spirosoma sp. KCTC 42546 TaxID=2520506 RepID=UPI00115A7375|nr:TolC family protein [Spirosoma sp. KCTC 42546]QDK81312.1 TolC family protein [Spirosoma sp. KCTC 42546]